MGVKSYLSALANRFCKNKVLRIWIMPIWRAYHKKERQKQIYNFRKYGQSLLEAISDICTQNNIIFWLDFGTLLGAYREKDFIKHDFDIDIGIMFDNRVKFQNLLLNNGFKLVREFKIIENGNVLGLEQTYVFKSVLVDIFYYHRISDKELLLNSFTPILHEKEYVNKAEVKDIIMPYFGFKKEVFKNINVYVPENTEEYLKYYYGKDFMIPDPNYDYKKIMRNIKYYKRKEKLATYKEYLKIYL